VGKKTGKNPTDRAKLGVKRSLLADGAGTPIGLEVSGANVPDMRLVEATLKSIPVPRPEPTDKEPQHLALDKGYDYPTVDELLAQWRYTAHIARRGKPAGKKPHVPKYRSRRWVVERSHSWFNRFRRLLIRWEKKITNYLALLHFACAWITWRAAEVLG
jgi:putative transposase